MVNLIGGDGQKMKRDVTAVYASRMLQRDVTNIYFSLLLRWITHRVAVRKGDL